MFLFARQALAIPRTLPIDYSSNTPWLDQIERPVLFGMDFH
jgi:hypothetical protein